MRRHVRSALILLAVGSLALASTLAWQHWTRAPIAEAEQQFYARRFLSVLAPHSYDNQPLSTPVPLPAEQPPHSRIMAAYRADRGTTPVAVVLVSQVQGYAAPIRLTIAINVQGRLIGTQVIDHQESPGLGGRISDPQVNWLAQFANRRLEDRWALKRDQGDFDQLAGATVTSRAVIEAQQDALRYFDQHRALLLGTLTHD